MGTEKIASYLTAKAVCKVFPSDSGDVVALDNVNLEVAKGDFVTILGPSGCGKSTFLYILAGLAEKNSGDITMDGQRVDGPGPDRGLVFQSYSLFPWLTVRENIRFAYGLKQHTNLYQPLPKTLEQQSYADFLMELVGLADFANSYPEQLSGGMKQRVAIARTLAARPKALLMDEPFGALDSQTREEMQDLLLRLRRVEQLSVVFVTHDVDEAIYLADRVAMFTPRPGKIQSMVEIPLGAERQQYMKMEPEFIALKRQLLQMLNPHAADDSSRLQREDLLQRMEKVAASK